MKFGEVLRSKTTPEWRTQYLDYEEGKRMLSRYKLQMKNTELGRQHSYMEEFQQDFFEFAARELEKIEKFLSENLEDSKDKLDRLQHGLDRTLLLKRERAVGPPRYSIYGTFPGALESGTELTDLPPPENEVNLQEFEFAFSEFYLNLILLKNYQQLNQTAFRKILKKYDKTVQSSKGAQWRKDNVVDGPITACNDVEDLIVAVENEVIEKISNGDRKRAMDRLRVPPLGEPQHSVYTVLRTGFWTGAFAVLLAILIFLVPWSICDDNDAGCWKDSCNPTNFTDDLADNEPKFWDITIRLYRGMFLFSLMILLLGINFYGWAASGVNHVLIFELDPRDHLGSLHLIEVGIALITACSVSLTLWLLQFYIAFIFDINPDIIRYLSLSIVLVLLVFLFNPFKVLPSMYSSRIFLLKVVFRIVTAPFHDVRFADFWLADQFTSLVPVFQDFVFVICTCSVQFQPDQVNSVCDENLMILTSVIGALPAWFRFWQCVRRWYDTRMKHPHLTNAGKYSCTFFVIIFKTLHSLWTDGTIGPSPEPVPSSTPGYYNETTVATRAPFYYSDASNPFLYLWILAATVNMCYTYSWDIKMDWGLLQKNAPKHHRFLRTYLIYSKKWYYYTAMVLDAILRSTWTLTVAGFKISDQPYITDIFITSLTFVEMLRRFVWNFFRLENEHINNCGEFRAVRRFSIAQPSFHTESQPSIGDSPSMFQRASAWIRNFKSDTEEQDQFAFLYESQNSIASLVSRQEESSESVNEDDFQVDLPLSMPRDRSGTLTLEASFYESFSSHHHQLLRRPRVSSEFYNSHK